MIVRIVSFVLTVLLVCAGCAPAVTGGAVQKTSPQVSQQKPSDCQIGQANCQSQPVIIGQEDSAELDLKRLVGLSAEDAPKVFSSDLSRALDALTVEDLAFTGLTPEQISGVKYELIPVFTRLRSTGDVLPVFNAEILSKGLRVFIQKPEDEETSKKLFAKIPYTREQLVEVIQFGLHDYEIMTGLPTAIVEKEQDANLLIGISDDFFLKIAGGKGAPGYSDADEGGFSLKESAGIGKYLQIKGRQVYLNPLTPKDYYDDREGVRLYAFFPEKVVTALFLRLMRTVTLQEIIHSTCYAGGWSRQGLGHTSTITSVMYSGVGGGTDYDVRIKQASESLGPNETQLLVQDGKQYVIRSRLAPLQEDIAGIMVRALRAIVKKFNLTV